MMDGMTTPESQSQERRVSIRSGECGGGRPHFPALTRIVLVFYAEFHHA